MEVPIANAYERLRRPSHNPESPMNASTVVRCLVALPLLVGCGGKTTTTTPAPALDVNPRISTVLVGGAPVALAATRAWKSWTTRSGCI